MWDLFSWVVFIGAGICLIVVAGIWLGDRRG